MDSIDDKTKSEDLEEGDIEENPLDPEVLDLNDELGNEDPEDTGEKPDDGASGRNLPIPRPSGSLARLDPLAAYLNEIRSYKDLTEEEEHELAVKFKETGDVKAAYRLATHNLTLVVKIAMTYRREWENMMDLIQEGNVGLMKAVQHFDPFRGVRLPAYASWWIKAYILKFILDNWRLVKVGTTNTRRKLLYNLKKEKARLEEMGIDPTSKNLAEHFGVDEKEIIDVEASIGAADVAMDTPTHPDSALTPAQTISDGKTGHADEVVEENFFHVLREKIEGFMENLKPVERDLIATRILSENPRSLKEIGEDYGVTREAVRQSEQRLLKKMKLYLAEHLPEAEDYFNNS
ncbi:MAG: sigma-70 family RNA polymerase sigma factor [Candidatus Nitronauta litoralis]|uniref:Sigma-70 family RNA polymerase sigma factor n=1 Tax=Candidatus Nitronauta litoralis TaxID=2705533 RepID=A0A7T0BV45_9BACT|nr:MAG: sigma-70 family RNA polymerase sigma factor [Candidatus Nitronauta litoralis]